MPRDGAAPVVSGGGMRKAGQAFERDSILLLQPGDNVGTAPTLGGER